MASRAIYRLVSRVARVYGSDAYGSKLASTIFIVARPMYRYIYDQKDKANSLVPILAFYKYKDHLGDIAISGSIFGRVVALSLLGADVLKLR